MMRKTTEAYYQRIFEDAPIGIYRTTIEGKILDANKTFAEIVGFPNPESVIDINISNLFVNPKKRTELISQHLSTHKVGSFKCNLKCKDGKLITVRETFNVIRDDDGTPIYLEGILEDTTERAQSERDLENIRNRIEEERAQRLLADTLRDIANLITGTLDFKEVIQQIFKNLGRLIPFDSAALILYRNEKLQIVAGHGIPNIEELSQLEIEIKDDIFSRQIIETRQPLILNNPTSNPHFKNYGKNEFIQCWLGIPLIARNISIGILTLDSASLNEYKEPEMQIALTLASQIAAAIENARLFNEERRRADIMSALRATITDITSELDLTTLFQSILERAVGLLAATGGELALYDETENTITIAVCHNMDKDYTNRNLEPGRGAIGKVIENGNPVIIDDYSNWDGHFDSRPWHSVIVVPLKARDRTLGAIALADATEHRRFNEADLQLISLFAQQAAIAIDNVQLFENVQELAEIDELTQTNNRRQLFALGKREFDRARRYVQPLSVIMLDIDNFKKVNDSFGHAIGDEVLRNLTQFCIRNIREVDILGRYGGEEFVIVIPNTDFIRGYELAERLCHFVEHNPISTKVGQIPITISLGVAEITSDTPNLAALIDQADTAMYNAKKDGKNRVKVFKHSGSTYFEEIYSTLNFNPLKKTGNSIAAKKLPYSVNLVHFLERML